MMLLQASRTRQLVLSFVLFSAVFAAVGMWAAQSRAAGLLPHGYCFTWFPQLLWLHVISDALIFIAYLSIPVTLWYFIRKRTDLPFNWMFQLFGAFIVACGTGHAMDIWTIWNPDYWLSGAVKAMTAAVSVPTAMALVYLIPNALAIPSTEQLRQANGALQREVHQRQQVEAELRRAQCELEQMVQRRSEELDHAKALLSTVFERAPVGLGVWDTELRFVRVNETLACMTGVPRAEQANKQLAQILPDIEPQLRGAMQSVLDTGRPVIDLEVKGVTAASAVERVWSISFYAVEVEHRPVMVGGVWEEVTEKRQAELERGRSLADAEAANRQKDEFLAMLAHELRNPLAPLTNALKLMARMPASKQQTDLVAMADRHTRQLTRLVDDLLEVSRITRGTIALRCKPMALADAVHEAVESVLPAFQSRQQVLDVDVPPETGSIIGDKARIVQVLTNLLHNASKFTPSAGRITVAVQSLPEAVTIRVSDTGVGIAADKLPHVFDLFVQAETTFDRAMGGLGIGLALVKRLVELHGGSVSAASDGRNRGTCLTVSLPRGSAACGDSTVASDSRRPASSSPGVSGLQWLSPCGIAS